MPTPTWSFSVITFAPALGCAAERGTGRVAIACQQSLRLPKAAALFGGGLMPTLRSLIRPVWLPGVICLATPHTALADGPRDFNADTPGKSYTPYTVAEGYFQLESDLVHVTSGAGTVTVQSLDPVIKYGLTDDVEIEVQTGGLVSLSGVSGGRTGYGDTVPAIKWNVYGNDWQVFTAAVRFGVKLPTAARGIGDGAVEFAVTAPVQVGLPYGLSLQVQEEVDLLKNQNDTGRHFDYQEDVSVSRSFGEATVSVEMFAESGTDPNSHALYTADVGVGFAVSSTVVVSFGAYVGLNRFAPEIEGYTGFAFRF